MPPELTQDGLARAGGFEVRHASQYIRPLLADDLVTERMAHVEGSRQRRKIYGLTPAGRLAAIRLRDRIRDEPIRVVLASRSEQTTFGKAVELAAGRLTLSEILRDAMESGVLDLRVEAGPRTATSRIKMIGGAPRLDRFVGRESELAAVTSGDSRVRLFVVRGVAGIGKSSFGAKASETIGGEWNLFWHSVRPWDTRSSLLASLADFLVAVGRPGLKSILSHGEAARIPEALRTDLAGAKSFLVFDDAHEASGEGVQFLRTLKEAVAETPDVRVLILTRRSIPFYDRRDVTLAGLVHEIELGELSASDTASLLASAGEAARADLRRAGGHPLLFALLQASPHSAGMSQAIRDMHRFIEEQIFSELPESGRTMLKLASLYRVPVPRDALFADPSSSHEVVMDLTSRALLRPTGGDTFEIHDTIRDFLESILTPEEKSRLGTHARTELRSLAERATEAEDFVASADFLSNALRLAADSKDRAGILERLGDARERMGDLPATVAAFAEAAKLAVDRESRARIHRKTASAFDVRAETEAATREAKAGLEVLGSQESIERGWLELVLCGASDRQERWAEARQHGQAALAVFREANDSRGQAHADLHLADIEIEAPDSDPRLAEQYFRESLALAENLHEIDFIVRLRTTMAHFYAYRLGDQARALQQIAAIELLLDKTQDLHSKRSFLMLKAWFTLEIEANLDAAREGFAEVSSLSRRLHDAASAAFATYGQALCAFFRGDLEDARSGFERFGRDIGELGFPAFTAESWWMCAETSLRLGDLEGFRKAAGALRGPSLSRGAEARPVHVRVLDGMEAALAGDEPRCRAAFAEAVRLAQRGHGIEEPSLVHFAHAFYGVCLKALGHTTEGEDHVRQAKSFLREHHLEARLGVFDAAEHDLLTTLKAHVRATAA